MAQLETALDNEETDDEDTVVDEWMEQLGAELDEAEFETAIQECEDEMEQDQDYNRRVRRIRQEIRSERAGRVEDGQGGGRGRGGRGRGGHGRGGRGRGDGRGGRGDGQRGGRGDGQQGGRGDQGVRT
jgi:hypothetical protein